MSQTYTFAKTIKDIIQLDTYFDTYFVPYYSRLTYSNGSLVVYTKEKAYSAQTENTIINFLTTYQDNVALLTGSIVPNLTVSQLNFPTSDLSGTLSILGTCYTSAKYFAYDVVGDICFRNETGRFLFSNTSALTNATPAFCISSENVGMGVLYPTNKLEVLGNTFLNGGLSKKVAKITATVYSILSSDHILSCDTTSNAITLTLPSCSLNLSKEIQISKSSSDANIVTILAANGNTIAGNASKTLTAQYSSITLICLDSTTWAISQLNIQASVSTASTTSNGLFNTSAATDGSVVFSVNSSLTRNMYYVNLTVNSGIILNVNGWRITVAGILTLNGTISNSGGDASGLTAGTCPTVYTTYLGCGTNGGNGSSGNSNAGIVGIASSYPNAGGKGGSGGGGSVTGGTVILMDPFDGGKYSLSSMPLAYTGRLLSSNFYVQGGTGGASGVLNKGSVSTASSGGGGAGGGVLVIAANVIAGSGFIKANGGKGGNAVTTGTGTPGIMGGGGGGAGGLAIVISTSLANTITVTATGGTGGSGTGPQAAAGSVGENGTVFLVQL